MDKTDQLVQSTDFDALSSRLSAYLAGYIPEDVLLIEFIQLIINYHVLSIQSQYGQMAMNRKLKKQFFNISGASKMPNVPKPVLKPPIINQGTYLRTKILTQKILQFINSYDRDTEIQLLSLGAGNDTRFTQILPTFANVSYYELDFAATTRIKRLAILSSKELSRCVGAAPLETQPHTTEEVVQQPCELHTEKYHLLPMDLRDFNTSANSAFAKLADASLDPNKPTLVISECCICYLSQDDSDNMLSNLFAWLPAHSFVMYEPIGRKDGNYGAVMERNLLQRGLTMPTLMVYDSVPAQIARFERLTGQERVWAQDMKWCADHLLDEEENTRIKRLEMLDEREELDLINSHYCLLTVNVAAEQNSGPQ